LFQRTNKQTNKRKNKKESTLLIQLLYNSYTTYRLSKAIMSRDSVITNSIGVQGKIIGKSEEVRPVKKIPANEKEAKEYGFSDEQVKTFVEKTKDKDGVQGVPIQVQTRQAILEKVPKQLHHCTRLQGVEPTKQPVVTKVEYDMQKGIKHVTTVKEKHHYDDPNEKGASKKYKKTVMTEEQFPETITQHELNCMEKNELFEKIQEEVDAVDLNTINNKEDILNFAKGNDGVFRSNTEKKRRAVTLLKRLDPVLKQRHEEEMKKYKEEKSVIIATPGLGKSEIVEKLKGVYVPKFERPRITSLEIASL